MRDRHKLQYLHRPRPWAWRGSNRIRLWSLRFLLGTNDVNDRVSKKKSGAWRCSPRTGRRFDAWVGTRRSGNMPQAFGRWMGAERLHSGRPTSAAL